MKEGYRVSYHQLEQWKYSMECPLDPQECVIALQIMEREGHNVAYFGMNGCYLFSELDRDDLQ